MNNTFQKYPHLKRTKKAISQLERKAMQGKYGKPVITVLVIAGLIIAAVLGYKFVPRSELKKQINDIGNTLNINKDSTAKTTDKALNVEPTKAIVADITGETDIVPKTDTIYLVKDEEGFYFIFITNSQINTYFDEEAQAEVHDPNYGDVGQGEYKQAEGIDYREYKEKIRLYSLPTDYIVDNTFYFVDYFIYPDNSKILISFVYTIKADAPITDEASSYQQNAILDIDLKSKKGKFIWKRKINDISYENYLGAVTVKDVVDKYITGGIAECFGCGDPRESVIIINIETGKDLMLGDAINLSFETEKKTIFFDEGESRREKKLP
jgi:hypothetical protein